METVEKQPEEATPAKKVFLGGINNEIDESVVEETFGKFGKIAEVLIIRDKATGSTKGYGFVTFETPEAAKKAVEEMHTQPVRGRSLTVQLARPDSEKESFQRRRPQEYRRSPPMKRMGRDQNRSRSRSRERREPRRGSWDQDNRDAGRGRWRGRDDGDLRHQIREQERMHMQRREQESRDAWHGNEASYGGRQRGEMAPYGRAAQGDRQYTRWDPNEDERRRRQIGGVMATSEISNYYGEGQASSSRYYNERQEQERQREFRMKRDVPWGSNQEAGRRPEDHYYNTNRQPTSDSTYRQDDRPRMRSEQVKPFVRSESERMHARDGGDRMPMRMERERMGTGVGRERMSASEWSGAQLEGARGDRSGVSDRGGIMTDRMAVGEATRMGVGDRLSMPHRLGDVERGGGYERTGLSERSGLSERGGMIERATDRLGGPETGSMHDRMGGAERRSGDGRMGGNHAREWMGMRPESERTTDRLEGERSQMREDPNRWRWGQEDQQVAARSESGRMDSQRERSYAMQSDSQMNQRESRWEEPRLAQQPSSRYYDERRDERGRGSNDGYRAPSSHQQPVTQQSRWESTRDSARVAGSQYDPYGRPAAAFSDESSRFSQQPVPYGDSRVGTSVGRPPASYPASQSLSSSAEARNFMREYEGYSPTKPQIYEDDDYSHQPAHYPRDSQPKSHAEPPSHRPSNPYSREGSTSQAYTSSSPQSGARRLDDDLEISARRGYRPSYPSENPLEPSTTQNPRYSYSQSQSRADASGYSQSSDWKDAHPMSHSEFQQSSYNEANTKLNPNPAPSRSSSSLLQHADPSSSQPTSAPISGPVLSEASSAPSPGSGAGSRVQIVNSPAVLPIRPVNSMPTVPLRAPMYGYRAPVLLRPQVGIPGLQGLAARVFSFAGNRSVRPQ